MKRLVICSLLLAGCTSRFMAFRPHQDSGIDELRMEVADLRDAVHGAETEMRLLEERTQFSRDNSNSDELSHLRKKIALLEKNLEKMGSEIRSLATHTSASLDSYKEQITSIDHKLSEIAKLRAYLTQLSQNARVPTHSIYQVQPGDTLQKIARDHRVSIEALKQENQLSSDKIVVGQKLTIPQ